MAPELWVPFRFNIWNFFGSWHLGSWFFISASWFLVLYFGIFKYAPKPTCNYEKEFICIDTYHEYCLICGSPNRQGHG